MFISRRRLPHYHCNHADRHIFTYEYNAIVTDIQWIDSLAIALSDLFIHIRYIWLSGVVISGSWSHYDNIAFIGCPRRLDGEASGSRCSKIIKSKLRNNILLVIRMNILCFTGLSTSCCKLAHSTIRNLGSAA